MKKTIFMMSILLALLACQKQTQTISIPTGYEIVDYETSLYISMWDCARSARIQAAKKDLQNAQETDYGAGGFMVAGTVDGVGPVILACHAGPGKNATYATFIKRPARHQQAASPNPRNHG
ncbi:MAG TPA: hypothetical protein VL625_05875 [Patescibacteria group bacterium]|nr:hypothetical protein [Patescibacteria group bacterium]